MRLSELRAIIDRAIIDHGDLEVICTRYSDYQGCTPDDFSVVSAVDKRPAGMGYLMRAYANHFISMDPRDVAAVKQYFHIEGL